MIICFSTHKGGTGKTTSSINLAAGLAQRGFTTLLLDVDPQGHAALGVGVEIAYDEPSMADVLGERPTPLESIIRETSTPGLWLAPSTLRLASVAESLVTKFRREDRLKKSLDRLGSKYQWIVIDCPPALGVLTANAVVATDAVIVPCQMGARALDGLGDLLDLLHVLKGETFDAWHILLAMIDARITVTREIFEEQLQPYKAKVLGTTIYRTEALNQAQMAKKPIFAFDVTSRGAQNYAALTEEVLTLYP
jgi:chromosome partitioning protein